MTDKSRVTIFHLYRKDGSVLFLHPFKDKSSVLSIMENNDIEGLYGEEPRVESLTLLRNDLYRLIEDAVKEWVNEQKFIPRFLFSALIFLLTYFAMAVIIPDPIPVIDELLIASGVSIALFLLLSRKDRNSSIATKKRMELRAKADRITFNESAFVRKMERYLQNRDSEERSLLVESILEDRLDPDQVTDELHARKMIEYLENRFNSKEIQKKEKNLEKMKPDSRMQQKEKFARWADSRKIDLSLFAVYRYIKRHVKKT